MVRSFLANGRIHYGTGSSWARHDHACRQSCNTAIASFARGTEQRTGHQPKDGGEVAEASYGRGYEDRAEGAAVDSFERSGSGGDDGVARRTKRLWTDEEKRSICFQTAAPGVSVAQVALRYAVNANLIFKWRRDPAPASRGRTAGREEGSDGPWRTPSPAPQLLCRRSREAV